MTSLVLCDNGIIELPDNLGCLSSLIQLHLAGNSFESIPASIANLSNLLYLHINNCKKLKCLPKLQLLGIDACNCTSLEVLSGVSFKSRFQPVDDYDIFADFGNYFKLDRNTFEGIMKDTSVVCYPGHEIPEWFNFRSMGSLINVELPQNSLNHNFLCFVFCVVVGGGAILHWKCNLRSKDGHPCIWDGICDYEFDFIESHHVLMASEHEISPDVLLDYENEISFEFYFHDDSMEGYTVEKCGVHLMIAQLPEEPNVSFRVGEVEDNLSLASVHDNCERVNEPHPKRLKFN
ncbi:hypothetical protein ACOSP7_031956 [Xanthoceras sorbifolium]